MLMRNRLLAIFVSVMMLLGVSPITPVTGGQVYAASPIGTITVDGNTTEYSDFRSLKQALEKHSNKTVTVTMLSNWDDSQSGMDVDERLKIPANSITTLIMDGYSFNRDLTKNNNTEDDGELIVVKDGATLIVEGKGRMPRQHNAYVYKSTTTSDKPVKTTFVGGLLTGGASFDGAGGIHLEAGANVTLNDVTLAGCRATRKGYGGGIYLVGSNHRVILKNSTITGCFAQNDGGGIYAERKNGVEIQLDNSHIDKNYANSDGGGINVDGDGAKITGSNGSTISYNECKDRGGGLYLYGRKDQASGLTIKGNKAKMGGGVYIERSATDLTDLILEENTASDSGGGICYYIWGEDIDEVSAITGVDYYKIPAGEKLIYLKGQTIRDCTIRNNTAKTGGGVYMEGCVFPATDLIQDVTLTGKVIIEGNNGNGDKKNLYVGGDDSGGGRIGTDLTEGSRVLISYYDNDHLETITLTPPGLKDKDSAKYLYTDQEGWYFSYSSGKTTRIRGRRPLADPPTKVDSGDANDASARTGDGNVVAGKVGTVSAGGAEGGIGDSDEDYDLIRFFSDHEAHDFISAVYYSDGLFYGDPYEYNEHLATATWALAYAGSYLNRYEKDPSVKDGPDRYYNKHAAGRQFLADIGCPDQNIYVNDSNVSMPYVDTIGVTIGSKELMRSDGTKTGDILIPVTIRGMNYDLEWLSNVLLGSSGEMSAKGKEAMGFSDAADKVTSEIFYYLDKYGLTEKYRQGNVKFWVTGFSRAGATSNMVAKRLIERIEEDCSGTRSQVFAYTCEAAKGGTDDAEKLGDKTKYYCIHNLVNNADLVPYVAPEEMGFKRYGVDHYIPGSSAGTVSKTSRNVKRSGSGGVNKVTTYKDNTPIRTKGAKTDDAESKAFVERRDKMQLQLRAVDSSKGFDDYFHPMTVDVFDVTFSFKRVEFFNVLRMYEFGDYENNRVEDFVADFVRFVQEGKEPGDVNHWSQAINSRDRYAKDPLKLKGKTYSTVQSTVQDLMLAIMVMPSKEGEVFLDKAKSIMDKFSYINATGDSLYDVYANTIGGWHNCTDTSKEVYANLIYDKLLKTGAYASLSPESRTIFDRNYMTLLDLVLKLVDGDFNYKPKNNDASKGQPEWAHGSNGTMMYLATLFAYKDTIMSYHLPYVNLSWARSYDGWYDDELTEYTLVPPESVAPPKAFAPVTEDGETVQQELAAGESEENVLQGDQHITLENDNIAGEAIYYDLIDITSGKTLTQNRIYRGGIDLTSGDETKKEYQIRTYDMSYGVRSEWEIYNITLRDNKHKIIIRDKDSDGNDREQTLSFSEAKQAIVQAGISKHHYFRQWSVKLLDDSGAVIKDDVTDELLATGDESIAANEAVSFDMPKVSDDYPDGYQLEFTASYAERIKALDVAAVDPKAGEPLADSFMLTFDVTDDEGATINREYPVVWTYDDNGSTVAPANDEYLAYNDTVYTATITVPQDQAEGIMFFTTVDAVVAQDPESSGKVVVTPVTRNTADGSITVQIRFGPTEDTGGDDKPSTEQTFKVNAIDLNTNAQDIDTDVVQYSSHPHQTMTITAPDVPGELFVTWDLKDSGIVLADIEGNELDNKTITIVTPGDMPENAEIDATYIPVVKTVDVMLYDEDGNLFAPVGGGEGPARVEMFVKVSNEYEVHPDNLELTWFPEPGEDGRFDYLTSYTATVSIVPDENGRIKVRPKDSGGDYNDIEFIVVPADDMTTSFNEETENVTFDLKDQSVSKVFDPTGYTLKSVKNPDNIYNVDHGKSSSDIEAMLPATTRILTENGMEFEAEIEWTSVTEQKEQDDPRAPSVWAAQGKVILPDTVENSNNVSVEVSMTINVAGAAMAHSPTASLESGTYLYNQVTTLQTNEPDGTTYYTTDGSEPTRSSKVYDGEQILVSRDHDGLQDELNNQGEPTGRKVFVIKAFTVKDGMWDSNVSQYEYVFDTEVPVPAGETSTYTGRAQTGVYASPLYTLEPVTDGVTIDEDGNAVAVDAGTYEVKAKLVRDDFKWVCEEYVQTSDETVDRSKTYYAKVDSDGEAYTAVSPSAYTERDAETGEAVPVSPSEKGWFEKKTSSEDQIIRFTIDPADISEVAEAKADGEFKSLDELKAAFRVDPKDERELAEGRDYTVSYGKINKGKVTVTVTGIGNYTGTITATYVVRSDEGKKYTITYDLNGGKLDGVGGVVSEQYIEGTTITLPKPTRKGYIFDYWKGSKYKAGQKYKVTEDHTFTAQWREDPDEVIADDSSSDDGGSSNPKTGDASNILGWLDLLAAALIGLLTVILIRLRHYRRSTDSKNR